MAVDVFMDTDLHWPAPEPHKSTRWNRCNWHKHISCTCVCCSLEETKQKTLSVEKYSYLRRVEKLIFFHDLHTHTHTHLSYIFKVVVSLLQGSGSVQGFPYTSVFAEESFTVVFYPVHHLDERETQPSSSDHPSRIRIKGHLLSVGTDRQYKMVSDMRN